MRLIKPHPYLFIPILFLLSLISLLALVAKTSAAPEKNCLYMDHNGKIHQASSPNEIPSSFRKNAKCGSQNQYLANPQDIPLEGSVRREDMSTSVGRVELRWPRKAEVLFGRTPNRALLDVARTLSRVLNQSGFPTLIQNLNLQWKVVFLDEKLPEAQIPMSLVSNCHPGWMTPPGNIYIVAQRVVAGCSGAKSPSTSVADGELADVLLHEMGHAVEYQLLLDQFGGNRQFGGDRLRSEGFATWFEQYAADFSSVVNARLIKERWSHAARESFRKNPSPAFSFTGTGTAEDYGRASMFFTAIVNRRGIKGLMDVYDTMVKNQLEFFPAVQKELGWNVTKLHEEAKNLLK